MSTTVARPAPTQGATKKALAMILGIPVVIGLMLWAFLAPTFASGPDGVPVRGLSSRSSLLKLNSKRSTRTSSP